MRKLVILIALVLTMSTASAQMIGVTNNQQTPRVQRVDNSPVFRPTVGSLRFSAGFPEFFTVSYNHYFTSYFMIGGGTGLGVCPSRFWPPAMPIFAEMDLRTPKYKWSLFLNLKIGVNLFGDYGAWESDPFVASADVGISYKNLNLGVGLSPAAYHVGAIDFFVSYNLPVSTIEKWLFK